MQATQICSISDCDRPHWAHGLCRNHGARLKTHGDPLGGRRAPGAGGTCSVDDCSRARYAQDLCKLHAQRKRRTGSTETTRFNPRTCSIGGCDRAHLSRGWCSLHYGRWERNGDPLVVLPSSASLPADQNCKWQGMDVTYGGAHSRVRTINGPASARACVDCGQQADQWSYDRLDPDERIEPDDPKRMAYSAKVEHYQARCNSCHWKIDHPTGKPTRT